MVGQKTGMRELSSERRVDGHEGFRPIWWELNIAHIQQHDCI